MGSASAIEQWLSFAGEAIHLNGNGVIQLGTATGRRAILTATEGGRIFNGPNHTLQSSGLLHAGRILGPGLSDSDVALTNEGTILAADRSNLSIHLNSETHYNDGTMRATGNADLSVTAVEGRLWNRGLIMAEQDAEFGFQGGIFFNDLNGVVRASGGTVRFSPPIDGVVSNAGVIEAIDGGAIVIEGKNLLNQRGAELRAARGGTIVLRNGTFRWDNAHRIMDEQSSLMIANATHDNLGSLLTAEPGILELSGARIIGGQLNSGSGRLKIGRAFLEDLQIGGTVSAPSSGSEVRLALKGSIQVVSYLTVHDNAVITLDGADATLHGEYPSSFQHVTVDAGSHTFEIGADHWLQSSGFRLEGGTLRNDGVIDCSEVMYPGFSLESGTLTGTGALISRYMRIDGVVSPGEGIGTVSLVGHVTFGHFGDSFGTYIADLGVEDSDRLVITGNLEMTTDFDRLVLNGGLVGESYVIAQYTGERTGIFDTVTPGYNVIYDDLARQIRVEPIPEPASVALAIIGMMGVLSWRRRRFWRLS